MRTYLLLAAGLALASCAAQKALPVYTAQEQADQRASIPYWQPEPTDTAHHTPHWAHRQPGLPPLGVDSLSKSSSDLTSSTDKPGLLRRLFPSKQPVAQAPQVPRKCKGRVFNLVAGNQTNAGKKATVAAGDGAVTSVVEKKAGPSIVASDSSTLHAISGGGNIQATTGNNNAPQLTAPVQQAADWRATLAKPVGYALASVGTVLLVGGVIFLIAAYKRRNALNNNG